MRSVVLFVMILALAACASTNLEKQAGSAEKKDCLKQAQDYVNENIHLIPNEWRDNERYKYYQKCLLEKQRSS